MSNAGQTRASDAERDAAAAELREHFAAGRLSEDELGERLEAVYGARTVGELDELRSDLPALEPSPVVHRAAHVERRQELSRNLLQHAGGSLSPFAICTLIWLASGAQGAFWPAFLLIFPVLFVLRNGWRLYGPAPELDRVQAELERQGEHRRERHERRREHPDRRHQPRRLP